MNRPLLAAAALLAAACSTGPTTVGLRLSEPSAIVAYRGVASGSGDVRPLLAVASRRSDDLRLIDPNGDLPIFGPGVIFPLSIPTAPRPLLLASASLNDGGADVLVAVSAGSTSLQVIKTWTDTGRVEFPVPLDTLGPDAEILCVLGIPAVLAVDATPTAPAIKGVNARVLVAATGGQLVVVEFTREVDAKGAPVVNGAVVPGIPQVKPITFDAIDMALVSLPSDAPASTSRTVFLASRDAVGTVGGAPDGAPVFGVGELDGASDLNLPFVIAPLDARAPTVAVAAGRVDERKVDTTVPCSPYTFTGAASAPLPVRVYAALDESGCGPGQRINCGIVTLDPITGQLADDLGARAASAPTSPDAANPGGVIVPGQTYRAPMPVVGVPLHIAIGFAPAAGSLRHTTSQIVPSTCATLASASSATPLVSLQPSAGPIDTSAVAMVTSSDGHVYWYDLGRAAPVNDANALVGGTRASVTSASTSPLTAGTLALGLWSDASDVDNSAIRTVDPSILPGAIETWPGFTEGATWRLVWQGPLPSLQNRAGVIATIGGQTFATFQTQTAPGPVWSVVAPVSDPALGVHRASPADPDEDKDILELPSLGCETRIDAVLRAGDAALAGVGAPFDAGAVLLETVPRCLPEAAGAVPVRATLTVRASGLVLVNDHSGYMGRPVINQTFTHAWLEESTLEGAADPATLEQLALARKARRIYYPINSPCPIPGATDALGTQISGCYLGYPPSLKDPLSPGPALRLRPAFVPIPPVVTPGTAVPARDTTLTFATSAGLIVTSRRPAVGGALPSNMAVVDPTSFKGHENESVRFYVPYADDQVAEFTAAGTATQVTSLR